MVTRYTDYDLSARNTFRMKVRCALYIEVTEEADLPALDWDALPQPVMVMGGGSNLLFTGDFPGTIVHYGAFCALESPGALDQVRGIFGRGGFLGTGPGPGCVDHSGPEGISAGPGPEGKNGPRPKTGWTRSTTEGALLVSLPAGTVFDDFCAWAAAEGLWGPENLSLIPGEVGASAVQNIGAYGVEAKDIIAGIRAWDRLERRFVDIEPADCEYGYRTSKFKTEWKGRYIITAVTYRLSRTPQPQLDYGGVRKALELKGVRMSPPGACPPPDEYRGRGPITACSRSEKAGVWEGPERAKRTESPGGFILTPQTIRDTIIDIRRQKLPDPEELGSAGSFFCNPVISKEHFAQIVKTAREDNGPDYQVPHFEVGDQIKVPAAWMIDQCGFKGATNGGAQVYNKQPLVIVNASGNASPEEIIGLEKRIIDTIAAKYGIVLHPEVEHV